MTSTSKTTQNHDYWVKNLNTLTENQKKMYNSLQKLMDDGKYSFFVGNVSHTEDCLKYITFPLSNNTILLYSSPNHFMIQSVDNNSFIKLNENSFSKLDEEYTSEALSCLVDNYWDIVSGATKLKNRHKEMNP